MEETQLHVPEPKEPSPTANQIIVVELRPLLLALRQARLIELGAIEDTLGMERSVEPKRKRE